MLAPAGGPAPRHAIAPALASALLASALLAVGAHAQTVNPWDGPAAIGVEVKNQSGKTVPGARVPVRLTDLQPPQGPAPVGTDPRGQAIIGHLAEGSWYVEVSHPEAMLFTAYVETRTGKAAKSTF